MNDGIMSFGPGGLTVIAVYLLSLIVIGWLGRRARRAETLREFYLAGGTMGFFVLVLTLYATQYSGNTLFGFTGKSYRIGYSWVMSVHFMTAIIVCYLLFAPQLQRQSKRFGFITPTDYLTHRFASPAISTIATLVMVVALSNYLLAQLMAMGRALEGLTRLPPETAYFYGVIVLALIMVIYETLGGLRAVAWTDVIQGVLLLAGFAVLVVMLFDRYGSLATTTESLLAAESTRSKVMPPGLPRCGEWLSYLLLVGLGGALYPQAIQRIYAARSGRGLRLSLAVMAFLPLTTALIAVLVGITALAHHPGLAGPESDRALTLVLNEIQHGSILGYWLVVILFAAILAAVMSTADSALLSISSIVTKDLYAGCVDRTATEARLTQLGKIVSWVLLGSLVVLALALREKATLIRLLDRKFDLLVQLAPAFILGTNWSRLRPGPVLAGLVSGLIVALTLAYVISAKPFGFDLGLHVTLVGGKPYGFHPGLYGLALNLAIAVIGSLLCRPPAAATPGARG